MPHRDRLGRHPHRQAAAVAQRDLVLPPVLHPVPGFLDLVTAGLVMLVRHRNHRPRCWRQVHHPTPATYPCRTLPICAPTPCLCRLGTFSLRAAEAPLSAGRSARSFLSLTTSPGPSSAGSITPPSRRCPSLSVRRSWPAYPGYAPIPPYSKPFGTRQSCAGDARLSAYARPLEWTPKLQGKAIKCENIVGRYSHV